MDFEGILIKSNRFSCKFTVLNCIVLEAQVELDKKFGHYQYLLLEKRSFPGSFGNTFSGGCRGTLIKLDEFGKFHHIRSAPPYHWYCWIVDDWNKILYKFQNTSGDIFWSPDDDYPLNLDSQPVLKEGGLINIKKHIKGNRP